MGAVEAEDVELVLVLVLAVVGEEEVEEAKLIGDMAAVLLLYCSVVM